MAIQYELMAETAASNQAVAVKNEGDENGGDIHKTSESPNNLTVAKIEAPTAFQRLSIEEINNNGVDQGNIFHHTNVNL